MATFFSLLVFSDSLSLSSPPELLELLLLVDSLSEGELFPDREELVLSDFFSGVTDSKDNNIRGYIKCKKEARFTSLPGAFIEGTFGGSFKAN